MILDFQERLADYADELKLDIPLFFDTNDEDLSLSVYSLPGSKTIRGYMNGAVDKVLNFEFQGKAKKELRDFLKDALLTLSQALELSGGNDIVSDNGSFEFSGITVASEPYFSDETTDGFIYFRLTIKAEITIFKESGN